MMMSLWWENCIPLDNSSLLEITGAPVVTAPTVRSCSFFEASDTPQHLPFFFFFLSKLALSLIFCSPFSKPAEQFEHLQ